MYTLVIILSYMYHPLLRQDPKAFATCLLDFIGSNAQYLYSKMVMTSSDVDTSKDGQHADRLKQVNKRGLHVHMYNFAPLQSS